MRGYYRDLGERGEKWARFAVGLLQIVHLYVTAIGPVSLTTLVAIMAGRGQPWFDQREFLPFIGLSAFQLVGAVLLLRFPTAIKEFGRLQELTLEIDELQVARLSYQTVMNSYLAVLSSIRGTMTARDTSSQPPLLTGGTLEDQLAALAEDPINVFLTGEASTLLALGYDTPPYMCVSLYVREPGSNTYHVLVQAQSEEYRRRRDSLKRERREYGTVRSWSFRDAFISSISRETTPHFEDDLQQATERYKISDNRRDYDGDLYRGAIFLRSNWTLRDDGTLEWDTELDQAPAYFVIITSSLKGAFPSDIDHAPREVLLESVRDFVDTLLHSAYHKHVSARLDNGGSASTKRAGKAGGRSEEREDRS